ncbi:MAG: tetratricopeptide repeat protein [Verrucomicrobia bacterium]|nr:tetratricopeptide repeat protein [Verrucomicrobiota bacterium]
MNVQKLPPSAVRQLEAVEGWLALGNPQEARAELAQLGDSLNGHPQVLDRSWEVAAALKDWEEALRLACARLELFPADATGWVHRSYALRRCKQGGLQHAWDALAPAVAQFPKVSLIPYNIACYAAQLGKLNEAWDWINKAVAAAEDVSSVKELALRDEDLRPLWDRVRGL